MTAEPKPRPPTLTESIGSVVASAVCALFGHVTNPSVPFCLWCGRDDADRIERTRA